MTKRSRRKKISFKATKIISRPARVTFFTKDGRQVEFTAKKSVPKSVKVEFLARNKKKK